MPKKRSFAWSKIGCFYAVPVPGGYTLVCGVCAHAITRREVRTTRGTVRFIRKHEQEHK